MKDYKNQIEAILFASGRPMSVDTIMNLTGSSGKQVVLENIERLKKEYESRESPIRIIEEKGEWKMTVRELYLPIVRKIVSDTELPKTILETLAVIAWGAPVLQSKVVDIRHNKAYDHIAELEELGFIYKEKKGRSYVIKLANKFFEYFEVEGNKGIREIFKDVKEKKEQSKVDDFESSNLHVYEVKENKEELQKAPSEHLGNLEVFDEVDAHEPQKKQDDDQSFEPRVEHTDQDQGILEEHENLDIGESKEVDNKKKNIKKTEDGLEDEDDSDTGDGQEVDSDADIAHGDPFSEIEEEKTD